MSTILTLRLDDLSQTFFERMRQQYFPPARNIVPAHLTLFHQLGDLVSVDTRLKARSSSEKRFPIQVTGLRSLGKGVAFTIASPELLALWRVLSQDFQPQLTAQDRQKFMPHIVIQNKATAQEARVLLNDLQRDFRPRVAAALGLDLWKYLGGPWQHLETFWFQDSNEDA